MSCVCSDNLASYQVFLSASSCWPYTTVPSLQAQWHLSFLAAISRSFLATRFSRGGKIQEEDSWDWRDGSVIRNTCCSCRRPGFGSQNPHGSSQPSVISVLGDPPSSGLHEYQMYMWLHTSDTHHTH